MADLSPVAQLLDLLGAAAKPDGVSWLEQSAETIADGSGDIATVFPAAGRKLGRGALAAPADARPFGASVAAWRVDDAGRALLLEAAHRHQPATLHTTAIDLYERGDARERVGVLRGLGFFADNPALLPIVLDAIRTNEGSMFEAAICDNPYSSRHLPDLEFHKAVLKVVFVGLSIRRVIGLRERADASFCSSLIDYITEREAASRSVPPELWPFVALHPPAAAIGKIIGYLEHPNAEHRGCCAEALATIVTNGDERCVSFLNSRAERETEPAVKDALSSALALASTSKG